MGSAGVVLSSCIFVDFHIGLMGVVLCMRSEFIWIVPFMWFHKSFMFKANFRFGVRVKCQMGSRFWVVFPLRVIFRFWLRIGS